MANCNRQQLNITCGTDVVLHDRLIFDGETFDPNLSVGIAANLVSSLAKRRALDVQVVDDELLISVPWIEGTLPGCYGLEVTGSCNSKKWATYADSLIKYTKATRIGVSEVTVESDSYDITQEVGYCYSNSPVTFAEVTVDEGYGTPSVDVTYEQRVLSMDFHNLKGNGITDIHVDEQVGDEAVNTVTIKTDADQEGTEFHVKNGSRGNGIASSSESLSDQDGGANVFTITDDDGNIHEFHSKNGTKGSQGDSVIVGQGDLPLTHVLGQSTEKAISQKGVTDEMVNFGASANIDISSLTPQACTLGNGTWYKGSSGAASNAKHVALSVAMGERYTLTNNALNAYFAWMTSSYNPPYSSGDTMPLVERTNRILVAEGETVVITPPEGAAFLVLAYIDGGGNQCDWTLVKRLSNNMGERFGQLADADFIPTSIDVKSHAWLGHLIKISDPNVTDYSERWTARIVAADAFLGKRVRIDYGASSTMCRYAFLSGNIIRQSGSTVPYCKGETLRQGVFDGTLPEDCKFIYFYDNSDGTDVAPSFTVFEHVGKVPVYDGETKVDISGLTKQNCSLGAYNWYMSSSNLQRHIAVPVNPGETYKIVTDISGVLYAVVNSSYNPPYTSGNQIPFASCNDTRSGCYGVSYVTIPSDGAYLILTTTDGANFSPEISLFKVSKSWQAPSSVPKDIPVKLRVMQWNVGHWAMGTSYTSNLTPETFAAKKMKYRQMLNNAKADIVCCCEWSQNVVNAGSGYDAMLARDELFGQYAHQDAGTLPSATSYMRTSHFSNMPPVAMKETVYNDTVQAGRYFHTLDFKINGKNVKIVATHLDWNQGEHGAEYRQSQMEQLISTFADDKYVIICADWNCDESEYDQFITAGYQMANHGYLGDLSTYDSESEGRGMALDNIVCKGFMVSDIAVYDDEYELSDHKPIAATFTMID